MLRVLTSLSRRELKQKRVLVRADFDVGVRRGRLESEYRVAANLDTLKRILESGGQLRLVAHRGRPDGKPDRHFSLRPLAPILSDFVGRRVVFVPNPFDPESFARRNASADVLLFENLRFWEGEEKNDSDFARSLARWGDCYVNEAFAASHRPHASIVGLALLLPSYAGMRLAREVRVLESLSGKVKRPYVALLGGAKIETKLPLIRRFLEIADRVLVGGALANTLLASAGSPIGRSAADLTRQDFRDLLQNKKMVIPLDVIAARSLSEGAFRASPASEVRENEYIVDIGPKTRKQFSLLAKCARTIVWNGPLGVCEVPAFARGTKKLVDAVGESAAFKVIGGGDTLAVLESPRLLKKIARRGRTHVSTGGGAMLEFLAGKKLPGIEALKNNVV